MQSNSRRGPTPLQRPPFSSLSRRGAASPVNANSYSFSYAQQQSKSVPRAASAGPRRSRVATPDARHVTFTEPRGKKLSVGPARDGGAPVQTLLTELVEISQALAAYLQDRPTSMDASSRPHQSQQQATLKAQEIERIVKRVEGHFAEKIAGMERRERQQAETIAQLTADLQRLRQSGKNNQSKENDKLSGSHVIGNNGSDDELVRELRRVLQEEKRQRLFVEEQTQSLTEQHARVVTTLERRLQKQEDQLHDMLALLDQDHQHHQSTPGFSGSVNSLMSSPTPRRMLRQQLAQHQQTQKVLEAYRRSLPEGKGVTGVVKPHGSPIEGSTMKHHGHPVESNNGNDNGSDHNGNGVGADEDDADELLVELGIADVAAVRSGKQRQGVYHKDQKDHKYREAANESLALVNTPPAQPPAPQATQRQQQLNQQPPQTRTYDAMRERTFNATEGRASEELDDIALFLDNITRELESIDAAESQREKELSLTMGRPLKL